MWLIILALILLLVLAFLSYSGMFAKVKVFVGPMPFDRDVNICYKVGRGPFSGLQAFYKEIGGLLPECPLIGIFLDDPRVGCSIV